MIDARPVTISRQGRHVEFLPVDASSMRPDRGHAFIADVPASFFSCLPASADDTIDAALLEDNQLLGPSGPPGIVHAQIRRWGSGAYTILHTEADRPAQVVFSASDNSDPRTNGRRYTIASHPIGFAGEWQHLQTRRWLNHSRGRYFLRRGGMDVAPPLFANLGVTDICNLKCGICGSQNMLQPVNRRHMDFRLFSMVADTLFPLLVTVEFNSRGEPLLHPQFADMLDIANDYGIYVRLQTNGTQFQARRLHVLSQMNGDLSISIDATGELFEYARKGGRWPVVDEGVRSLMKMRDPDRLSVSLYPTLTAKTIEGAPALIAWAMDVGIDRIDFHQYDPIECGTETRPPAPAVEELRRHAASRDSRHPIAIWVNYEAAKPGETRPIRRPVQQRYSNMPRPAGGQGAHADHMCMAPWQQVDIDLDGGVSVCCMTQQRKLGNALTPEAFADCWFGAEYRGIRQSLRRPAAAPFLDACKGCIRNHVG